MLQKYQIYSEPAKKGISVLSNIRNNVQCWVVGVFDGREIL